MTKLSHIPMQIQKWIASLAHLFFLILGLIGISLMYINGNFGLGLTGIGSVPYEDTAEFNTQFNNDLNDIFLYMEYQDVFGAGDPFPSGCADHAVFRNDFPINPE